MKSVVVKVRQENTVAVRDKLEKERDKVRAGRSHDSTNDSRHNSSRITKRSRSKGRGSKTPSSSRGKDDKTGTSRKRHRSTSLDKKLSDKVRNKDAATEAPSDANASTQEVIDLTEDGSTASTINQTQQTRKTSVKLGQKSSNHEAKIDVNQTEQPLEKTKVKPKRLVKMHNQPHKGDTKLQRILNPPFTWVLCAVRDFRMVNYTAELMQINRAPEHKKVILENRAQFTKKAYKKSHPHLQDNTKTMPDTIEREKTPPTTKRQKEKRHSVPTAKAISVIPPLKKASATQTNWTIPNDAKFDLEDHEPKPDLETTPDQQDQGSQNETSAKNDDEMTTSEEIPIQGCPRCASYDPVNCIQDIPETDEGILTTASEDSSPEETHQMSESSDGEYVSEDDQVWQRDAGGHQ